MSEQDATYYAIAAHERFRDLRAAVAAATKVKDNLSSADKTEAIAFLDALSSALGG